MKISEICQFLENLAPLSLQENYDNSGLIVGDKEQVVNKVLLTLDCTEAVIEEAIEQQCELIIAHHPIVFSGLKKLNGKNYVERVVIKAIKHDIAIYAIHTNYDNVLHGVNAMIADRLGLINTKILSTKKEQLLKLVVFIPSANFSDVSNAVFKAGGGEIGNYSHCGFSVNGEGTFLGNELSKPSIGVAGNLETVNEIRFETIFPAYLKSQVVKALLQSHPYEEVAYDLYKLENDYAKVGSGIIGELPLEMDEKTFLSLVKEKMNTTIIRHTDLRQKNVKRVAVCGGSGSFLLPYAKAVGADFYITADFKYHEFFDAENQLVIADIGHFESEQFTKDLLFRELLKKFPKFAFLLSRVNTNPINYF